MVTNKQMTCEVTKYNINSITVFFIEILGNPELYYN
jgi:hypothetical protein